MGNQDQQITQPLDLALELASQFEGYPGVQAVGLGGSQAVGITDATSDVDLYVFTTQPIPLERRMQIMQKRGATRADMDLQFWDPGDEWIDAPTGIEVDVMFWHPDWASEQLERVLVQHQAWLGYTTSHWHTLSRMRSLIDPTGWLAGLQQRARQPYPEALRRAVVSKNHSILRNVIPSYEGQVCKAARRGDLVSVNHRVSALLASYFDVLFALNRQTHPGEKKLLHLAQQACPNLPENMAADVEALLLAAGQPGTGVVDAAARLLDRLDDLLLALGLDHLTSLPVESA